MSERSLSTTERNQMRESLETWKRLKLDALIAKDPGWKTRVAEKKRKIAIGKLGVEKELVELQKVTEEIQKLEGKKKELDKRIEEKMPYDEDRGKLYRSCPTRKDICGAIEDIMDAVHPSVMAEDKTGAAMLKVEEEYERRRVLLLSCVTREDVREKKVLDLS